MLLMKCCHAVSGARSLLHESVLLYLEPSCHSAWFGAQRRDRRRQSAWSVLSVVTRKVGPASKKQFPFLPAVASQRSAPAGQALPQRYKLCSSNHEAYTTGADRAPVPITQPTEGRNQPLPMAGQRYYTQVRITRTGVSVGPTHMPGEVGRSAEPCSRQCRGKARQLEGVGKTGVGWARTA
eukprot:365783-Chlamydomonas_euryale.AAC.4